MYGIKNKLHEMTNKEERGTLTDAEIRNPAYYVRFGNSLP